MFQYYVSIRECRSRVADPYCESISACSTMFLCTTSVEEGNQYAPCKNGLDLE